ncbi:MAG: hypothetical protein ABIF88_03915 [archaeon]
MEMKKILSEELGRIILSQSDFLRYEKVARDFIGLLEGVGIGSFIGGSFAKGTFVKKDGPQDVDIFVVFDSKSEINELGDILANLKLPGELKKVHGSRDYFKVDCGDVILEVIPVMKNLDPDKAENVTDVSLSHVGYIRTEIKKNPKIANEIRIAKSFCEAQNCYGAESYIRGFSGYSLEVLVIYFGGFVKFLKGIEKNRVVDPAKFFKNKNEIMRELNSSKLQGPLVLVDPTFKNRNACAGLGQETFDRFLVVSKEFLKNPSSSFFIKKGVNVDFLKEFAKKDGSKFVEVSLSTDKQEGDIAGTKMKKFLDFFASEIMRNQQKVLEKEFSYSGKGQEAKGYLVVCEEKEIEVRGPSVLLIDAVKKFKKAKGVKNVFEKEGYFWFKEKVSIKGIFKEVRKVCDEMGVGGEILVG